MHPKFIRINDQIYSVNLLKKCRQSKCGKKIFMTIDTQTIEIEDPIGYVWGSLSCFLEDLNRDQMQWKTLYCVETMRQEGNEINQQALEV